MPEAETAVEPANSDVITVTITVTDVNEAPVVSGDAAISFAENGDITVMLDMYMADDPEETADPTLALTGADKGKFTFDVAMATLRSRPSPTTRSRGMRTRTTYTR